MSLVPAASICTHMNTCTHITTVFKMCQGHMPCLPACVVIVSAAALRLCVTSLQHAKRKGYAGQCLTGTNQIVQLHQSTPRRALPCLELYLSWLALLCVQQHVVRCWSTSFHDAWQSGQDGKHRRGSKHASVNSTAFTCKWSKHRQGKHVAGQNWLKPLRRFTWSMAKWIHPPLIPLPLPRGRNFTSHLQW